MIKPPAKSYQYIYQHIRCIRCHWTIPRELPTSANLKQTSKHLQTYFWIFPGQRSFSPNLPPFISENPPSNRAPKFAARSICQMDDSKFFDGLPLQAKVILQWWESVMPSQKTSWNIWRTSPLLKWTFHYGKIAQKSGQFPVSHVENYWVNQRNVTPTFSDAEIDTTKSNMF